MEEKGKIQSRCDNVYSDQAKKAGALTRDHQDKLSFQKVSLLLARKEHALLHPSSPRPQPQAQAISMTQNDKTMLLLMA